MRLASRLLHKEWRPWQLIALAVLVVFWLALNSSRLIEKYQGGIPSSFMRGAGGYSYVAVGTVAPDRRKMERLGVGDGRIEGPIIFDDMPSVNCELMLLLNGCLWTEITTIGSDDKYSIRVPKGKYMLDGLAFRTLEPQDQFHVDVSSVSNDLFLSYQVTVGESPAEGPVVRCYKSERGRQRYGQEDSIK